METIIRGNMMKFIQDNDIKSNSQHGFLSKRICLINLFDVLNYIFDVYDERKSVNVIYLDFNEVFDKILLKWLLNKLLTYGIFGNIHNWHQHWLSERVVWNSFSSSWLNVKSGYPRVRYLALFCSRCNYANDIEDRISCKI